MKLVLLNILLACAYALASPVEQSLVFNQDGSYQFNYDTGDQEGRHARQEVRNADGSVEGRYSYEDPDGNLRVVNYRAGKQGFVASGDVGVPGAPKSQLPLVEPTPNDDEKDKEIDPTAQKHDEGTTVQQQLGESPTTVKPIEDDVTKASVDDGSYKREAGVPMFYGQHDLLNVLPISTPFGRRRLDVPQKVEEDSVHHQDPSTHLTSGDTPSENPVSNEKPEVSKDKPEVPAKETPAKPGTGEPLSFIYTVGSPFVPTLLHAPQQGDNKPVQVPVTDGKGAAKYYLYVPSHHYFGSPSYYYVPQGELKPEDKPQQQPALPKPEGPAPLHHSAVPVSQVPVAPVVIHPQVSAIQYHQPHLTAVRYQPAEPQVNRVNQIPVTGTQYFNGVPLSYHTTIHHTIPEAQEARGPQRIRGYQGQGAPQESAEGLNQPWSYTPQSELPVIGQGVPQESAVGLNKPWSYNPEITPQSQAVPVAQGHGSYDVSGKRERTPTVLTYIQPDSVKYIPATKPRVKIEADSLQDNVVPPSVGVQSVDQPSLRRPVYHHYVFKGPNASYGYHYQY